MKLILIASYYYPINDVSSLRIHSYCKALAQKGIMIKVLIVYPRDTEPFSAGVFEGVEYEIIANPQDYYSNFFRRLYFRLFGIYSIIKNIIKLDISGVLSYHDSLFTNIFVKLFTALKQIPFIIDKTEYPYGYYEMSKSRKWIEKVNLSMFDGFIVISRELKLFYSKFSNKVFLLPMTIDPHRFDEVGEGPRGKEKFVCLTFGVHNRDGLLDSVIAFNKYLKKSKHKKFKLYLIGDYVKLCEYFPECLTVELYIEENNLGDCIEFLGKVPIEKVPEILAKAEGLMTTPSKYVSGGFPTKIGEYMLSGVPLICTKAGEISEYLTDKYDSFLCEVNDLECIADKILYVEENPLESALIGKNAIVTAKNKFNATTYVADLLAFILSVKK